MNSCIGRRMHQTARRPLRHARRGSMTVEFAVCLPILLLMFFALWEYSRVEVIRQTVKSAAFEGSRQGIVDGATVDEMRQSAAQPLAAFGIRGVQIETTLDDEMASTTIRVPMRQNTYFAPMFVGDQNLATRIELQRESVE